jgi:hypothetical protein
LQFADDGTFNAGGEFFQRCRRGLDRGLVIVDGIALAGANGWYGNTMPSDPVTEALVEQHRNEDILY